MRVVFRVDASLQMGTGHVMRCLSLAEAFQEQGAEVSFICREHEGNLIKHIEKKGYVVYKLEAHLSGTEEISESENNILAHASWLGVTQNEDAEACGLILKKINPDWLIVDHYSIDYRWQKQLKKFYKKLMVIDDLADRKHECDLLLDQTFGRNKDDYIKLVPQNCKLLLGSQFALLRPEFLQWRKYSLQRRAIPKLKNVLISLGGVDKENITGQVLEILKTCIPSRNITITVILGASSPNIKSVKKIADTMKNTTKIMVDVNNMAELMAQADLAIGAAGATTWERCCLGLPSIQIVVAENQLLVAQNLRDANIIKFVEKLTELPLKLKEILKTINKQSLLSSSLTNGYGGRVVCDYLVSDVPSDEVISLKPVDINDCEYIYSLQTFTARQYSRNPDKPKWDEHVKWFTEIFNSDSSVLFIVMLGQQFSGTLRLDNINSNEIETSIIIAPEYSGLGIATKSLKQAFDLQPRGCFKAAIHKKNLPSQNVFEKLGFIQSGMNGDFLQYRMSGC